MANKMLIDAAHPEETRVVVLRGNRVEEFDFESAQRRQLRGNIYLAKVTRVEPSLQAAFVDYGGNRHGFLAFSEIHPDYYQIPVADRQALIEEEERAHRAAEAEAERRAERGRSRSRPAQRPTERIQEVVEEPEADTDEALLLDAQADEAAAEEVAFAADAAEEATQFELTGEHPHADIPVPVDAWEAESTETRISSEISSAPEQTAFDLGSAEHDEELPYDVPSGPSEDVSPAAGDAEDHAEHVQVTEEEEVVESVGGADALEEVADRMPRARRQYKIQEVIKRRQVLLVQVVKEERGTKGAALTTYLSLAGRYCVLMPNTARGGGISRKITDARDRMRLKEVAQDLEVPEGMGVILRTAGASRTKLEIKRDFEYLLRVWETVRDLTLRSTAPTLVYEEGSLVKRALRDLYTKDIDEIAVCRQPSLHRGTRVHAHVDAESRAQCAVLSRQPASVFALRDRKPARCDVLAGRAAALRRLHRPQSDRGAGLNRRQLRSRDPRAPYRGHRPQDQSGSFRRDCPAAAAARPRRPHRDRLHRHG